MCEAITTNCVEGRRNVRSLQARHGDVQHRVLRSLLFEVKFLEYVAMTFDDDGLLVDFFCLRTGHPIFPLNWARNLPMTDNPESEKGAPGREQVQLK
jgi:hypothetical protein